MMSHRDVLLLLCLSLGVLAAPHSRILSTSVGFLDDNQELSRKITLAAYDLREIMCEVHQLCDEEELRIIQNGLGLHATPLEQCDTVSFNKGACFSQLSNGLSGFMTLLTSARDLPQDKLDSLEADVKDLLTNIQEEMEAQGITADNHSIQETPIYKTPLEEKAGTFLILSNLHKFMLMVQNVLG
ncbi:myelomonocytic growth factor-like [Pelobates fuscus]|uniref:myelomonocytic growth factor-like n=1 Tax=Pelobates fuscus TaxID=191477 RepID=UPI002FE47483